MCHCFLFLFLIFFWDVHGIEGVHQFFQRVCVWIQTFGGTAASEKIVAITYIPCYILHITHPRLQKNEGFFWGGGEQVTGCTAVMSGC